MKRAAFIICTFYSLCLGYNPLALDISEETIATDSIDIFAEPEARTRRSSAIAMGSSLILPGAGHHYLGRNRSAFAYLTAEATVLFGFFLCSHYSNKAALDAAGFAWTHAGAQGDIRSADDYYWKQVANYMDVRDYNSAIDLDRLDPSKKITGVEQFWRWDSEESKDRFNEMLSASRVFHVISSFCIGALVLDRIIAFVDIRTFTMNYGARRTGSSSGGISITPELSFTFSNIDMRLTAAF